MRVRYFSRAAQPLCAGLIGTERQVLRRSQLAALGGEFQIDQTESTLRQQAAWPVGGTVASAAGPGHMVRGR